MQFSYRYKDWNCFKIFCIFYLVGGRQVGDRWVSGGPIGCLSVGGWRVGGGPVGGSVGR